MWRRRQTRRACRRAGPTAHAVGLPRAQDASHRIAPPCDERGVAHAPGDGVSGERSQDGGAKPMPREPKGMDARRERPATGCGQPRSAASTPAIPSRSRRRDGQTRRACRHAGPTAHAVGLPRAPEAPPRTAPTRRVTSEGLPMPRETASDLRPFGEFAIERRPLDPEDGGRLRLVATNRLERGEHVPPLHLLDRHRCERPGQR